MIKNKTAQSGRVRSHVVAEIQVVAIVVNRINVLEIGSFVVSGHFLKQHSRLILQFPLDSGNHGYS